MNVGGRLNWSPSKSIRDPAKDVTSEEHPQHVDRVVDCPVRIMLLGEEDVICGFLQTLALLSHKQVHSLR